MSKNAHLKGRRRFKADLEEMGEACQSGYEVRGLALPVFQAGDDEGAIALRVVTTTGIYVFNIMLHVSDASDYPHEHTFFLYCTDPDVGVPPEAAKIFEDITNAGARTIRQTIDKFLRTLSPVVIKYTTGVIQNDSEPEDASDGEDDIFTYAQDDDDYDSFGLSGVPNNPSMQLARFQRDFLEIVAAGYRPGLIRFGDDDFALSISIPMTRLTRSIPPRNLMAWDPRLLSKTQYLTLFMSGFRGVYPVLQENGTYTPEAAARGANLQFKVGLTGRYKPSAECALDLARNFSLVDDLDDKDKGKDPIVNGGPEEDEITFIMSSDSTSVPDESDDPGRFVRFSLSDSLESLLNQAFLRTVELRKRFNLGWAGAETLLSEIERTQRKPEDVYASDHWTLPEADKAEQNLRRTYKLPADPLRDRADSDDTINFPLLAFCYFIRRMTLCPRYCLVCHNELPTQYETLKPYVCGSDLCAYQYLALHRGHALEYEIRNRPATVDLLVSLTYSAAAEGVLDEPLPKGLGLRVPMPDKSQIPVPPQTHLNLGLFAGGAGGAGVPFLPPVLPSVPVPVPPTFEQPPQVGPDGLVSFDDLGLPMMRASIKELIDTLPSIGEMKHHLDKRTKPGKPRPKLQDMNSSIPAAAWTVLRWCIASCTAHLEELTEQEDMVQNVATNYKQFRFSIGAPDAEARYKVAVGEAQKIDTNTRQYPSLYAFHGSALRNWHSIIRHGLWHKTVANGRAFGNGIYFAKEGDVSMNHYAVGAARVWRNSEIKPRSCTALAEIVNCPKKFVSSEPYLVVADTNWVICRYLLVRPAEDSESTSTRQEPREVQPEIKDIPIVKLDPTQSLLLSKKIVRIPDPAHKIKKLLAARNQDYFEEDHDRVDMEIFEANPDQPQAQASSSANVTEVPDNEEVPVEEEVVDDWVHDPDWVLSNIQHMLPPPEDAMPMATMSLQKELKAMLKEQDKAKSKKELGWYMPPEFIGDNLFQWIVEVHSFEPELPIAQDMASVGINSLIFEIRFPPSYPHAPPFFRILKPRFLPFIQGGGGHVTGGGSMCMDLLTSDGWNPTYTIPAILLQIKLAISNLEPRPARLARNWDIPYSVQEALAGYKRAAATHGWRIPAGVDRLVR